MLVNFIDAERAPGRVRRQDCDTKRFVQDNTLPSIEAAFPKCECDLWHEGSWRSIDADTASLVVEGSDLKVINHGGEAQKFEQQLYLCFCPGSRI